MKKYGIPTAAYENFDDPEKGAGLSGDSGKFPIVLKADGLALGKGVLICNTLEEAEGRRADDYAWKTRSSAPQAIQMVIEEFMTGREVSVLKLSWTARQSDP